MMKRVILHAAVLLFAYLLFCVSLASASLITIDFEADTIGAKNNGFIPEGISGISLSDSIGEDLFIENFGNQGSGQRSLYVGTDGDASGLRIFLPFMADSVSLAFGNDDPNVTNAGDLALLRVFQGATQVGQDITIALNRDDVMNQTISFGSIGGSTLFDNVLFGYGKYYDQLGEYFQFITGGGDNPNIGTAEVVDNIEINRAATPIPEPGTLVLLSAGIFGTALFRRFHRKVKV